MIINPTIVEAHISAPREIKNTETFLSFVLDACFVFSRESMRTRRMIAKMAMVSFKTRKQKAMVARYAVVSFFWPISLIVRSVVYPKRKKNKNCVFLTRFKSRTRRVGLMYVKT